MIPRLRPKAVYSHYLKPKYRNNLRIHSASKGSGNKIIKKIFSLYRKRLANGSEWLVFHIQLSIKDHWGNNFGMPLELGFYELPQLSKTYSFDPHTKSTTSGPEDIAQHLVNHLSKITKQSTRIHGNRLRTKF